MDPLTEAIENALWRPGQPGRPVVVRFAWAVARHSYALGRDLLSGQLTLRAMSLVYTTLLSTVPFLAFSFSLIKVFGVHNRLQPQLYRLMAPLGPKGVEITDWIVGTIDSLEGGVLGGLSLMFFIYTAVAMVQKVESSFNYIWRVTGPRSPARRVTEYISVLLIGPVVMTVALGLIASISSSSLVQEISAIQPFGTGILLAGEVLPYLLVIAVFTFLYTFLPNAPVRVGAALTGGIVAGSTWAFVGTVFAALIALSVERNAIYGTFAVAISALIWVYVSWLILLIGAQLAFYVQNPIFLRIGRQQPKLANALRERIALNVMYLIGMAFRSGDPPCTIRTISRETNIPGLTLGPIISALEAARLISENEGEALVPGRDMARITVADILAAVRSGGETGSLLPPAWSPPVDQIAGRVESAIEQQTAGTTLSALLGPMEPP